MFSPIVLSPMMELRCRHLSFEACELTDRLEQKTTPRESSRISRTKGHLSKRTAFVREIVKEVSGYVISPITSRIRERKSISLLGSKPGGVETYANTRVVGLYALQTFIPGRKCW